MMAGKKVLNALIGHSSQANTKKKRLKRDNEERKGLSGRKDKTREA